MHRLQHVAHLVSIVLSNIREFQQKEEEHRLAALGAMSAGLAHEIRNPLAGIKGAAQYLQGEDIPDTRRNMLNVVIKEADRLNTVVSQFLEYARPFQLHLDADHVNALTTHVLDLLKAQGVPDDVVLNIELVQTCPSSTGSSKFRRFSSTSSGYASPWLTAVRSPLKPLVDGVDQANTS